MLESPFFFSLSTYVATIISICTIGLRPAYSAPRGWDMDFYGGGGQVVVEKYVANSKIMIRSRGDHNWLMHWTSQWTQLFNHQLSENRSCSRYRYGMRRSRYSVETTEIHSRFPISVCASYALNPLPLSQQALVHFGPLKILGDKWARILICHLLFGFSIIIKKFFKTKSTR